MKEIKKTKKATLQYKGKSITINYEYFVYENHPEHYTTDAIDERNIAKVKAKYKELYGTKNKKELVH